jgi:hypothetical protein
MQQLNKNTLGLRWDQLEIKPGDVVTLGTDKRYNVLAVSPAGIRVAEARTSREHMIHPESLRIVKKCSS